MIKRGRMRLAMLACVAGVALAPVAHAQTAEADALGREIAQRVLTALPLEELVAGNMSATTMFKDVPQRPEWSTYMADAAKEEFNADLPQFAALMGHEIAKQMTIAELRAGIELFRGPAGDSMARVMAASARKEPGVSPSPELEGAYRHVLAQPDGKTFLSKMSQMERLLEPVTSDAIVILVPGMMRRFGEKAEAGERARRQIQAH